VQLSPSAQVSDAGVVCVPTAQPLPDTLNCTPATLLPMFTVAVLNTKLAVMVFGPFMTTDSGFVAPVASPDQFTN
jgi:hypothetical protein